MLSVTDVNAATHVFQYLSDLNFTLNKHGKKQHKKIHI